MIYNFLTDYLSIIIFLFLALLISIGFIIINFISSPSNQTLKNYQRTNADLMLLMTLEWNLMFDFIWWQYFYHIRFGNSVFIPWAITLGKIGFWILVNDVLAVLTIGFIYEWKKGFGVGMRIIDTDEKLKKFQKNLNK